MPGRYYWLCYRFAFRLPARRVPAADSDSIAALIKTRTDELHLKPRTVEFTVEKAFRARRAIDNGDYHTAHQIVDEVLSRSQIQNWRFHPFAVFIKAITDLYDPELEARLNEWVAKTPNDDVPLLIRAQCEYDLGWNKRGSKFARDTPPESFAIFAIYMQRSLDDITAAIAIKPNPYSYYLRLRIQQGIGEQSALKTLLQSLLSAIDEQSVVLRPLLQSLLHMTTLSAFTASFEEGIAKYPGFYPLYTEMLNTLRPIWWGSIPEMTQFVERYAGPAPENSPLRLLYLELFEKLVLEAVNACDNPATEKNKRPDCITEFMKINLWPNWKASIQNALALYEHLDKDQFNVEISRLLFYIVGWSDAEAVAAPILQMAADATHTDTQLIEEHPHDRNDYAIDAAVGESWYRKPIYDSAITKYREALSHVWQAEFPDEEDRDVAAAQILDRLSVVANAQHEYIEIIVYQQAALALGGWTENAHYVCYGYYKLKLYEAMIDACTDTLRSTNHIPSYYWRAIAYIELGRYKLALQDLTIVADSNHDFRPYAAIRMSIIYGKMKDFKGSLDVLDKYRYLYDERINTKTGIAAAYNNRCYAYMELGDFATGPRRL